MTSEIWPTEGNEIVQKPAHDDEQALAFRGLTGTLDRYQRIEEIFIEKGFLPADKPEQVEALCLQSYENVIGGAAKHIAEIVLRQRKLSVADPLRAARSVTSSYIGYAKNAQTSTANIGVLSEELYDVNPALKMSTVVEVGQTGLHEVLRFFDLSMLITEKNIKSIGYDPQKEIYTPENVRLNKYLEEALESWRVGQIRKKLPTIITAESNRFAFWTGALKDISKYYPRLREVADSGLNELNPLGKVQ